MCGRFTLSSPAKIPSRFKTSNKLPLFEPSWNVTPSQTLPTITRNSPNKVTMMKWGLMFKPQDRFGVINIRSESTKEKPYFGHILKERRCIIPANGFYEWRSVNLESKDEKYPFFIYLKDKPLFGFAGIYNVFEDAGKVKHFYFAILTCPPNKFVKKVHHRMPVILEEEQEDRWLDPEQEDMEKLQSYLKPYSGEMGLHAVSKRVNSPKNDDEKLIEHFEELKLRFS